MYVCIYEVCKYLCVYVCMYVRMYVDRYVFMYVWTYVHIYVHMHLRTYVCIYPYMCVCVWNNQVLLILEYFIRLNFRNLSHRFQFQQTDTETRFALICVFKSYVWMEYINSFSFVGTQFLLSLPAATHMHIKRLTIHTHTHVTTPLLASNDHYVSICPLAGQSASQDSTLVCS